MHDAQHPDPSTPARDQKADRPALLIIDMITGPHWTSASSESPCHR